MSIYTQVGHYSILCSSTERYRNVTNPDIRGQKKESFLEEVKITNLSQGWLLRKREEAVLLPEETTHAENSVSTARDKFVQLGRCRVRWGRSLRLGKEKGKRLTGVRSRGPCKLC